jgi:hypothetical protein
MGMVVLSQHHVSLDQNRGAKMVKRREKERARNETGCRKHTITSTTPSAHRGYIFSAAPGPLPGIYGTILSGGRT